MIAKGVDQIVEAVLEAALEAAQETIVILEGIKTGIKIIETKIERIQLSDIEFPAKMKILSILCHG